MRSTAGPAAFLGAAVRVPPPFDGPAPAPVYARRMVRSYAVVLSLALLGCDPGSGADSGTPGPGMDGAPPPRTDGSLPPGADSTVPPGTDACVPQVEICGDRIDQNCDGRDTSCGDSDMDNVEACREGDDLTMCDCDDSRSDVRPPFMGLPGAPELCDGVDNDCNGRVDEHAECCDGCSAVTPRSRADVCTEAGECDCSTEAGTGPCPSGQTCCSAGCVDVQTDVAHCGFCEAMCSRAWKRP